MITIPIWQAVAALMLTGALSFFFGMSVLAWVSMAHYDGDEQRSEVE
jgi:Ca2+-dependent lipid-binding protein